MTLKLPAARAWLTAAEAAAEKLPEFEFGERQIQRFLKDGAIETRKRAGRGGGREFHWQALPQEAQAEYLKRYGRAASALETDDAGSRDAERQLRAQARAAIVDAAETRIAETNSVCTALKVFSKLFKARKAGLEHWIYEAQPTAKPEQVRVWRRRLREVGLDGLLDGRGRPKGSSAIGMDVELRNFVAAQIGARPHLSAVTLQKLIALPMEDDGLARHIPLRTLQSYIAPLRPERNALVKAVANPDQFRSHHRAALGSLSQNVVRINQRWEIDATRGDCMCLVRDEYGRETQRRQTLTMLIDVFTRRAVIVVSEQTGAAPTRALLRRAILQFGLPEYVKIDNGKEFKNAAVDRFCREAQIRMEFSKEFHPEAKAHVERMFGTVMHGLFELLPGYVGHNIAQRKAIEGRNSFAHRFGQEGRILFETSLSPADLQARIDAWLEREYHARVHSELGMPPAEMAAMHAAAARMIDDPRQLDALLMDAAVRQISKGMIRYDNRFYGSPETGALELTQTGRRVQIRVDPLDPGYIAVYSADGSSFLAVAQWLDAMAPEDRQRVAAQALANQNKVVSLTRRRLQSARGTHDIADRLLGGPNNFDLSPEAHQAMIAAAAPQLEKHRKMIEARGVIDTPPVPIEPTDEEREAAARMTAAMTVAPQPVRMVDCSGYRRPAFDDDVDLIFWWEDYEANGGRIDGEDRALRAELLKDALFCDRLAVARHNRTSGRSAGVV